MRPRLVVALPRKWSPQSPHASSRAATPRSSLSRRRPRHFSSSSSSSSVHDAEVEKFNAYGQGWWQDPSGRTGAGPLHALNPVRVRYILNKCGRSLCAAPPSTSSGTSSSSSGPTTKKTLRGVRILDVGCGGGLLSEALARLGASVTGIDPAVGNIDVARRHAAVDPRTQGIVYEHAAVEDFVGERFDAVVSSEVIEHVAAPAAFVKSLAAMLAAAEEGGEGGGGRDGSHLVLTTINRTAKAYLLAILGAEHIARMVPKGTHEWGKFLQPQEVARMGRAAGLRVEDVSGMVYNPFKNTWKLEKEDIDVNYVMHLVQDKRKGK